MLYLAGQFFLRVLYGALFRLKSSGVEHIPLRGPIIVASNHVSNFDPPTVGIPIKRKLHFMAKVELFKVPLFGPLIRRLGAFPVNRGGVSKDAIKAAIALLKEGKALAMFPEGSRNSGGSGKKGLALIAHRSGALIVPAAIIGNYKLFRTLKVVYGEPIDPKAVVEANPEAADPLELITEVVMGRIRELVNENGPSNKF
ncbi:lysophospholipid acyltransferase family protein [Paenibacillus protaetiae]|uniref:1-acyl-sn-glycerol-3-phosphate acyltransferase n=1 Tax=Paenibacillus protaetiae TaxID=2509456 RepID=A0A4P6ETD9_9BACL|nr:lysophospholipid acyltransferase family protein [Paenibacillus protaetiae]QAY66182.1 1-acyl-sn-glycerol-3-phosphate acyltransferase [Paenibacillus protaetiae]